MSSFQVLEYGKAAIDLDGDLTLPHAAELKTLFVKALVNADAVSVRFGDVGEVDLSLLQLFCSAHRSAVRLKKAIAIEGRIPQVVKDAADVAGYARLKGCKLDTDSSCIWATVAGATNG